MEFFCIKYYIFFSCLWGWLMLTGSVLPTLFTIQNIRIFLSNTSVSSLEMKFNIHTTPERIASLCEVLLRTCCCIVHSKGIIIGVAQVASP